MTSTNAENGGRSRPADGESDARLHVDAVDRDRMRLAGVVFAVLFAQVLLYPGIDTLVAAFGASEALGASTWFLAVEFAAFVLFAWVWGYVSDATGRRGALVRLGAAGAMVGYTALAALARFASVPFGVVLAVRALQGAATIGAFSLAVTMLMDLPGGHGRNMGAAGIAIGLGTALGAPVGGLLYEQGPVVPVLAAALLMLAIAVLAGRLVDRAPSPTDRRGGLDEIVASVTRTPAVLVPYVFGTLDRLTAGVFALVGTLYFRTVFGLSPGATGGMLFLFFGPFAVLQYPSGVLSDRVGRAVPVVVGSVGYGIAVAWVGLAETVVGAGLGMVVVGVLGAAMTPATMALVTDLCDDRDRGVAMAGFNAVASGGFLGGIVLGGLVAERAGFTTALLLTGAVEIGIAVLAAPAVLRVASVRVGGSDER